MASRVGLVAAVGFTVAAIAPSAQRDRTLQVNTIAERYARLVLAVGQGATLTFDEESRALYDAVAPVHPESYFEAALKEIDQLLPGQGPLVDRYDAFRQKFVIPAGRLTRVFDRAIAECRSRTPPHVRLPAAESVTVEYVTNKAVERVTTGIRGTTAV